MLLRLGDVNGELFAADEGITKHPFKAYVGRIKNEVFNFFGYKLSVKRLKGAGIAGEGYSNHLCKLRQLYKQGACEPVDFGWQQCAERKRFFGSIP